MAKVVCRKCGTYIGTTRNDESETIETVCAECAEKEKKDD